MWLPYGEKMVQIFLLDLGKIKKAICFNEHTQKSFLFEDFLELQYFESEFDVPSNEKEFSDLENYL